MLSQNPEYIDLTRRKFRKQKQYFGKKDLLLAAAPVYGGQLPQLKEALFTNLKGDHTPCILMSAYGNRDFDDTLAQMKDILEARGFYCIGAIAPIIPHIYSEKLGADRPNAEDEKVFRRFAVTVKQRLENGLEESLMIPGNPKPEPKTMKPVVHYFDETKCKGCQICVQKCPTSAIDKNTYQIKEELCVGCLRCERVCPSGARSSDYESVKKYLEDNFCLPKVIKCY